MTTENSIKLLISKSHAYKSGYDRAVAQKDAIAAAKWKDGYNRIKETIDELRETL